MTPGGAWWEAPYLGERAAFEAHLDLMWGSRWLRGCLLGESDLAYPLSLLDDASVERMRGLDNGHFFAKSEGLCYRDGWAMDAFIDPGDGREPVDLPYWTYLTPPNGERGPIELLLDWCEEKLGLRGVVPLPERPRP